MIRDAINQEPMLNQLINLIWTIASFSSIGWFWGLYFAENRPASFLITSIVLSLLIYLLPGKWLGNLMLSKHRKTYERLGLKSFRKFVQDGTLVNRHLRKYKKDYGVIQNRNQAIIYLRTIAVQERFHYCCLVMFGATSLCAITNGMPCIGLLILISNILYNVYPILLQQYNRLRIDNVLTNSLQRDN